MTLPAPNLAADKEVTRLEACEQQLDAAIDLFFAEQNMPAITLAGAAETVLADLLKAQGHETSKTFLLKYREKDLGKPIDAKEFHLWQAEVYNWLRHADQDPEATVVITPYEALMWIMRGVASYKRLTKGSTTATMLRFHEYWVANFEGEPQP